MPSPPPPSPVPAMFSPPLAGDPPWPLRALSPPFAGFLSIASVSVVSGPSSVVQPPRGCQGAVLS
eukprot:4963764-Pyramimonas_sp.AAC.1